MSKYTYTTFADAAPPFFEEGINVIPIARGAKVPPKGCDWKVWQTQPQTRRDINVLRNIYPNCDIAAVLGEVSENLLDLDPDSYAGAAALASLLWQSVCRMRQGKRCHSRGEDHPSLAARPLAIDYLSPGAARPKTTDRETRPERRPIKGCG